MLFDLTVIAFFSTLVEDYFMVMLIALVIFRTSWGKFTVNLLGEYKDIALRFGSLVIIVLAIVSNIVYLATETDTKQSDSQELSVIEAVATGYAAIAVINCQDADCWAPYIDRLIEVRLNNIDKDTESTPKRLVDEMLDDLLEDTELAASEVAKLRAMFSDRFELVSLEIEEQAQQLESEEPLESTELQELQEAKELEQSQEREIAATTSSARSPLAWFYGLLNDLGLGFGFSAVYFSCFTAWFSGQTLGKKLLKIQVIQLDNTPLSLWDAFGRYGGYGAGLATGLLGFFQIYWDFNRQAIQDKIASTVVIDLSLKQQEKLQSASPQPATNNEFQI